MDDLTATGHPGHAGHEMNLSINIEQTLLTRSGVGGGQKTIDQGMYCLEGGRRMTEEFRAHFRLRLLLALGRILRFRRFRRSRFSWLLCRQVTARDRDHGGRVIGSREQDRIALRNLNSAEELVHCFDQYCWGTARFKQGSVGPGYRSSLH